MKIFSKIETPKSKSISFMGLNVYSKEYLPNLTIRKYLFGFYKIKESLKHIKFYILGIQVLSKKKSVDIAVLLKDLKESIISENRALLSVYNLHSKVFPKFKYCNLAKTIVIVGCGPSANFYKYNPSFIHIGLNKAYKMSNINFEYLFFVDSAHKENSFDEIINLNCTKFLGFHCNPEFSYCNSNILYNDKNKNFCLIPEEHVIKNNAYRFYSNAHRNEIFYDIETSPLMDFGSVSFCAIHFALYTHPRKIYLVGCDCANNGYFNNEKQPTWNNTMLNRTFYGYKKLKKFVNVYYPDIEIISVNPVGLKGLFRDVYTKEYVKEHPELLETDIKYLEDEESEDKLCV